MRLTSAAFGLLMCFNIGPPASAHHMIWGINGHPFLAYPGVSFEEQLDHVADLGMTHYRVDLGGGNDHKELRQLIDLAHDRGIIIVPILQPPLDLETMSADDIQRISFDYSKAIAEDFGADVPVFELGNEMENFAIIQPCEMQDDGSPYPCDWGPAGGEDVLHYYGPRWKKVSAALKGMSEGVAAGAPDARRAIGTAGWGHTGAFDRMASDGIAWDITVWHTYSLENEASFEILAKWDKPIWITEFNNPKGSETSEAAQAEGIAVQMEDFEAKAKTYRIEAAFVYELLDQTYWAPDYESVFGLIRLEKDGDRWKTAGPKEAYGVVRELVDE
jgi:hypothetical protein